MKNTCFQIIIDYSRYKATVWTCDASFEFEVICNTRRWCGETTINEEKYSIKNTLERIFVEYNDSILAEIDFFTKDLWENFAQICIGDNTLFLKKSHSVSGLELTNTDLATVLILESRWHVDETKNWFIRFLTRQPYFLVKVGDSSLNQLQLLQLIAICSYCVVVLEGIDINDYNGKLCHVPIYKNGKRRTQWFDFWKHNR